MFTFDYKTLGWDKPLPAGINNGIAQLLNIGFSQYKKGIYQGHVYFLASAVVLEPESVRGITVRGLHTQIGTGLLHDTSLGYNVLDKRKTFKDRYALMLNELEKLGIDANDFKSDNIANYSNMVLSNWSDKTTKLLIQEKIYFRFRTCVKQSTVYHSWLGVIKGYIPKEW